MRLASVRRLKGQQGVRQRTTVAHSEFDLQGSRYVAFLVTGRA